MCVREYFYAQLYLNGQEIAPDALSSTARDAGPSSGDRNASVKEKSMGLGQVLARIREIFWHLSA